MYTELERIDFMVIDLTFIVITCKYGIKKKYSVKSNKLAFYL